MTWARRMLAYAAVPTLLAEGACGALLGGTDVPVLDEAGVADATKLDASRRDSGSSHRTDSGADSAKDHEQTSDGAAHDGDSSLGHRDSSSGDSSSCLAPSISCGGDCVDPLTDNKNCGGCGLACQPNCVAGECTIELAHAGPGADALAVDDTGVYWIDQGTSSILHTSLTGGTVTTVAQGATGSDKPVSNIALNATNVYWTTLGGTVETASKDGGVFPTAIASGQPNPSGIAADSTGAYWADEGNPDSGARVMHFATVGNATSPIDVTSLKSPWAVAVNGTSVYFTDNATGSIIKVPKVGGAPMIIAEALTNPTALAIDDVNAYWVGFSQSAILQVSLSGGSIVTLAGPGDGTSEPYLLATDGTNVYWTNYANGTVAKVPVNGGASVTIASGQSSPFGIAVDGTSVYWTNSVDGVVMKATPK